MGADQNRSQSKGNSTQPVRHKTSGPLRSMHVFFAGFNRSLWLLAAGWFVAALGFAAAIPFIAIYFHDQYGMSAMSIGIFFAVMAVLRSLFQAVGGELSDRIGRRGLMIISQLGRAVTFLFIALAIEFDWGFAHVAFWLLISSILGALFMPAVNAMVSDILPKEKHLDGFAVTRAAGNLGWAVGPAIGGILSATSFSLLFYLSATLTLGSGLIFFFWLKVPPLRPMAEPFRLGDLLDVRKDKYLARHVLFLFVLYLVVAQLIMPFSLYAVEMVGLSNTQLGLLFGLNGLLVAVLQVPATIAMRRYRLTTQLAVGSLLYLIGYGSLGIFVGYYNFMVVITVVTLGEIIMSPASLALTSRLAPPGRIGRYMGIYGFFVTAGWSLGPLWGGGILDLLKQHYAIAWLAIASLALVPAIGYLFFGRSLPWRLNQKEPDIT